MAAAPDVKDLKYSKIGMTLPAGKTHAEFNNNPGNIKAAHPNGKPTDYAKYLKRIGVPFKVGTEAGDTGYFFHFPDAKTGYLAAQRFWLETKDWMTWGYGKFTLDQALKKYSGGGYDIEKLQAGSEGRIDDIDGSVNIMDVTDEQWARIMNEQLRWEDVNYYNKIKKENFSIELNGNSYSINEGYNKNINDNSVADEGGSGEQNENNVLADVNDDKIQNEVAFEGDKDPNTEYQTIEYESVEEAKEKQDELNDGDFVVINDKTYRYDKQSKELIRINDQAEIIESVDLGEIERGQDLEEEQEEEQQEQQQEQEEEQQEEVVEEVEEEEQEQQEEEVVTEERGDDPNTPARGPEPKESDRQRVEVSDMQVGKYYTILDPEKSEIVDDTGNLQDGVVELVAITENGEYEFQNTKTGKVFRVPADGLSGKLAQTNKDDVALPQYNGITIQKDTNFIIDGKAYSREDLRRIGGGTVKDGINKLTEGKTEEEKKEILREAARSQNEILKIKESNSQIYDIYGELPDAVDADSGEDGILDKDGDGIPDTIDIDAGEGSNQVAPGVETPEDKPEGDKPEGEITNLQRAGEIGKNLLQGVGTLLDAVGGPGAIVSYIMGKKGMEAAMKEIEPQAMPELSPMFMQHLRQAKELAKRGFHPDQEREFRKELDTAYGIGLENAVRGSGGQRARFLAQSGILDAQRSSALLDFAAKDAELQAANQDKYEKVMLFKENFDLQRSEQQRAEDMARQREEKEAAAGFVGSAFSSLMNSYSNMNTSAIMNKMVQSGMQSLFNPNTIIGLRNQDAFKNNETYQNITKE